ncbi:MAG TPA: glycosyltransferase family 4 protein [Acidimicrobiales bacterium]|nr:glycosyltransferase family 4 protein [Acidimicrobiales bacterium]
MADCAVVRELRVLLTHTYCWPEVRRGAERYIHERGAALVDAGHDVRIVATAPQPSKGTVLDVPVQRLQRRTGPTRYGEFAPEVAFGREVLVRHLFDGIDVWHAFGTGDAAAAAFLSSVRLFPKVRSVYTDLGGPVRSYREQRPDHRLFQYAVRNLDAYVCLSEATRAVLESDYDRRGLVVGGGVDLVRFAPPSQRSEVPTLLFMSAVDEPRKNLPLLLEAFDLVVAARPEVRLMLAGPGDPTSALADSTARVRAATDVHGVGDVEDVASLYGAAWTTVLPSMREAFGLVLVESLASGTPIVAIADSGGPVEIVQPGIGVLARDQSPAALANACLEALALAAKGDETRDACRREAVAKYSWEAAIVPRLEQIYRGELTES